MQIAQTNTVAKIAALVAGLGLVAMTFVAAAPAKAADTTFNVNLTVGSKGADVSALQTWLIAKGYSIPAGATGYFGAQTKAAVAAYQKAKGISPAVGYFGPLTRASVNADGGSTSSTGGSVSLSGVGRLKNVSSAGDVTSDLKEGDSATSVVGVSADAIDGDVQIQRVDAQFYLGTLPSTANSGSSNLNRYVSDISLYVDGKKVASMDPAMADKSGRTWTVRFSSLNAVIKKGATGYIYVKVTPVSTVDSAENAQTVTASLTTTAIRAIGGDGISETYGAASQVNQAFTVSSRTSGTLTVSPAGDNPKASQIAVSSSTTSGVKLLSFTMKAKNQDVKVTDLVASFGTTDSLSDVVSTIKLMKGSTVLKTKTLSSGTYGTVTFDSINETISKDQTNTYTLVADLKGDSAYADGTTLTASTTVTGWDVSDAEGNSVTPSAVAVGNAMTLTGTGISVTKGTVTAVNNVCNIASCGDTGTYTIPFTVTAGDTPVYIAGIAAGSGATNRIVYATTTTSGSGVTGTASANFTAGDTQSNDSAGAYYYIPANTSRTFTLTVSLTATSTGYTGVQLNSVAYGPTSSLGSTYSSGLDAFKTTDIQLVKH